MTSLSVTKMKETGVDFAGLFRHYFHSHPSSGYLSEPIFPRFEELYEMYCEEFIRIHTDLDLKEIDRELLELKKGDPDAFDIERGFRAQKHGALGEAELMDYLLQNQYTFVFDGKTYNQPVIGVW